MKKFYIVLAAAALMVGCAKENAIENTTPTPSIAEKGKVVTLTANLPELTKASVDATAFAWENGDQIAVPSNATGGYTVFTTSTGSLGTFKATIADGVSLIAGKAIYPASAALGTYSTVFSSIAAAKKGFKMEADYTVGASSLSFKHKSAIVCLTFNNVPSFATGLTILEAESTIATIALPAPNPNESVSFYVPITPNGSKKYSFSLYAGDAELKKVSKTVELSAGTYYSTPAVETPIYFFVSEYDEWSILDAYVYYQDGENYPYIGEAWPGNVLKGEATYTISAESYYKIDATASKGLPSHVILNAGDANLAKPFTRIETDAFTPTCSKLIKLSTVSQDNLVLYFRDDTGQNNNWGDYKIYGWYDDDTKIFGNWPGWSKNADSFTWTEYSNYGQTNNWFASYTFTGKPAINLIMNDGGNNQTGDINLEEDKDNWLVVSDGCTGTASTESFPTVQVSVE